MDKTTYIWITYIGHCNILGNTRSEITAANTFSRRHVGRCFTRAHYFSLEQSCPRIQRSLISLLDHALLGQDMGKADVVDKSECQIKCIGNTSCKSVNIHTSGNKTTVACDLNSKTRKNRPKN